MESIRKGDYVVVRTFGGFPRVRRLWLIDGGTATVVEDQLWERLQDGDLGVGVVVPLEDVFFFDQALKIDPKQPYGDWRSLTPIAA